MMMRVVPDNDLLASHAETDLNYLSDYESTLPFPAGMYRGDAAERNRDLHAWLSTATFKREVLKARPASKSKLKNEPRMLGMLYSTTLPP